MARNSLVASLEHISKSLLQTIECSKKSYPVWLFTEADGLSGLVKTKEEAEEYLYWSLNSAIQLLVRLIRHPEAIAILENAVAEQDGWMGDALYKSYWPKLIEEANKHFPESEGFNLLRTKNPYS